MDLGGVGGNTKMNQKNDKCAVNGEKLKAESVRDVKRYL